MWNESRWSFTPSRLRCLFLGHDDTFAREPKRLFLRCDTCGRQTRGWTIGPPPGTAARHVSAKGAITDLAPHGGVLTVDRRRLPVLAGR